MMMRGWVSMIRCVVLCCGCVLTHLLSSGLGLTMGSRRVLAAARRNGTPTNATYRRMGRGRGRGRVLIGGVM